MSKGKLIVIAAPSGSGKTSIVKELIKDDTLNLRFSISATTRKPRSNEVDGKDYYFKSQDEFKELIKKEQFLEWEEVYEGQFYGTLFSEVERLRKEKYNIIFDIDVNGALAIKEKFNDSCLSIFIQAPDLNTLRQRLEQRKTEHKIALEKRLKKVKLEMSMSDQFDVKVINENLEEAISDTKNKIKKFIDSNA
jgi:guanylate kinase